MGLDGVELLMEIEDSFDVPIPDRASVTMITPGDVFEFLVDSGYKAMPKGPCLSQPLFHRLRRGVMEEFNVERSAVRPTAEILPLLPHFRMRSRRQSLFQRLVLKRAPPLLDGLHWLRRDFGTFRKLALETLTWNYGTLAEEAGFWNPGEAWNCMRMLIVYHLGVKIEKVTRDANFVNDLGMD
jgi:acyl carrier protein